MSATRLRWVLSLARRAVVYELALWRSLYRWIVLHLPAGVGPGDKAFSYAGVVMPILGVFIGLSTLEVPILDLILRHTVPWERVRHIAVGLGIWGVLWMIGLLASLRVHPHVLGDAGLRIRNAHSVDVTVPWSAIAEVRHRYRSLPSSRAVQLEPTDSGLVVNISTGSQTSVDVILREPTSLRLPKGPTEPARELRFYADDPNALVARAREHLTATAARKGWSTSARGPT
jgi:hypothetical protein